MFNTDLIERDMQIPKCMASRIIGLKGSNIRAIKSRTGVRRISTHDEKLNTTVRVMGSVQSVDAAMDMIKSIMGGNVQVIGLCVEHVEIDSFKVQELIGPRGRTIKGMQGRCGACIEVQSKALGAPSIAVVTGSIFNIALVKEALKPYMVEGGQAEAVTRR